MIIDSGVKPNEEYENNNNKIVMINTSFKDDKNYVEIEIFSNISIIQYRKIIVQMMVKVKVNVSFIVLKKINDKRNVIYFRRE